VQCCIVEPFRKVTVLKIGNKLTTEVSAEFEMVNHGLRKDGWFLPLILFILLLK